MPKKILDHKSTFTVILLTMLVSSTNCSIKKLHLHPESYDIINTYFKTDAEISLHRQTLGINEYFKYLSRLENWDEENDNLANNERNRIKFTQLFDQEKFTEIIKEFTSTDKVKLRQRFIQKNIRLKSKARHAISYPYIFEHNNEKYALIYGEVTNGPENAAGGVTLFINRKGKWEDIFYFHLVLMR